MMPFFITRSVAEPAEIKVPLGGILSMSPSRSFESPKTVTVLPISSSSTSSPTRSEFNVRALSILTELSSSDTSNPISRTISRYMGSQSAKSTCSFPCSSFGTRNLEFEISFHHACGQCKRNSYHYLGGDNTGGRRTNAYVGHHQVDSTHYDHPYSQNVDGACYEAESDDALRQILVDETAYHKKQESKEHRPHGGC